ncbi:uncharacterized protein LOC129948209 [Eupeodes corollae]|uniref:uncharacterized protein LOC129948209 n=1 Tax=Eupeodes corollae TaxID=290404 RepID=UPI0024911D7E|nr:uncharacterized protein LOC129948209 [Eupeodes corollae]
MPSLQVFLILLLAFSVLFCNASKSKENETKRAVKPVEFKRIEKKSTNEIRGPTELPEVYSFGQREEPFRPIYQYHYPGEHLKTTSTNYVANPNSPQLLYNKQDSAIPINAAYSHDHPVSNGDGSATIRNAQYVATNSYKPEAGIQYASSSYKSGSQSGSQYASSEYRGPFVSASQTSGEPTRSHPEPLYSVTPVEPPPVPQTLPPQSHQQNYFSVLLPPEYVPNSQQNLATQLPLIGAQMVQIIYGHNAGPKPRPSPPVFKDQQYKQVPVQYVTLIPPKGVHSLVAVPGVVTHIVPYPYYEPNGLHQHQQMQQIFYNGAYNPQSLPTSLVYAINLPNHQQSIHKQQIYGPIQTATGTRTVSAADSVNFKPMMVEKQQQLQQQTLPQFYQHYHPGAAGYTRYSQNPSSFNDSGGSSNPVEVSVNEATLKQNPIYSTLSSTNNLGNTYSQSVGSSSSGKMAYAYGTDPNYEGHTYTHPGVIHDGTHLYPPTRNVVQIGSKPVTAGSAVIAGVSPPSYHPQQQSPASNSKGVLGSSSTVVMKFA